MLLLLFLFVLLLLDFLGLLFLSVGFLLGNLSLLGLLLLFSSFLLSLGLSSGFSLLLFLGSLLRSLFLSKSGGFGGLFSLFFTLVVFFSDSDFFHFKSLLSLHLLLDLEHLKLSLGLSSRELVLSLQSGEVGLGSSFLGGGSLGLLDGLSSKELLLHLLGFEFLGSLLLLELFEFDSSSLGKLLLILSILLSLGNLSFKLLVLVDLHLSLFLLVGKLIQKSFLLRFLLLLKLLESSGLNR